MYPVAIQCHSWLLLVNLLRRTDALDDDYINVIERLLELKADPRASFEGMNMSVVDQAERLDADAILALFYRQYPELRPEKKIEDVVFGGEILYKLNQFENAGTDFEDAQVKQNWLEPVNHISVVAEKLKRIPESLGKLSQLRTLALVMIEPKGRKLPATLANLLKLESLVLGMSGFSELPDLSKLTQLKKLSLRDNSFKDLPALPDQLAELMLDQNPLSDSTDLSNLINLKHLSLHGVKTILKGLEHLVQLEELHWSNAQLETFPESVTALPKLRQLVLSGNRFVTLPNLQALTELEVLDLQNCRLERLPEGLLRLSKLKQLLFSGNLKLEKLIKKTKDAASLEILGALRDKGVVFEDSADSSEEAQTSEPKQDKQTRNALKQIQKSNKRAYDFQTAKPSNFTKAIQHYENVLEISQPFLTDLHEGFDYEYLFALQGKLWCINEIVEQDPTRTTEAIALAQFVLGYAKNQFNACNADEIRLARATKTLAHNSLGWYLLQNGNLSQALEHVNAAIEDLDYSSQDGTHAIVLENKVKILLALERNDDAYAVVYQVQRGFPELPFFKQLTQTLEYQQWDAEN
jgi:Leucine-rich repeat (LRR) protein